MRALLFERAHAERLRTLHRRLDLHRTTPPEAIPAFQRDRFNEVWAAACRRYRFYAEWRRRFALPERVERVEDLRRFPVLRKADLQAHADSIAADAAPCDFAMTGGSTGTPTRYPVTRADRDFWYVNALLGKSWSGIRPGEPTALLWGHSHLFGSGPLAKIKAARKRLVDYTGNVTRLSAYHLDEASLASYAAAIRGLPNPVVIGFASALRRLMDHLEAEGGRLQAKAVIFASEVSHPEDHARARRLFRAPSLSEYGSSELGHAGYSTPDCSDVTLVWDAFYGHALPTTGELVITTLQDRRFPYINYGMEDLVEPVEDAAPLLRCRRILGRANDTLLLTRRDGSSFETHSMALEDTVKNLPGVESYFVHQKGTAITVRVRLRGLADLDGLRRQLLSKLALEFPNLDDRLFALDRLNGEAPKTPAGKTRFVVRE